MRRLALGVILLCAAISVAEAEDRRAQVAATVGPRTITVGDIEDRVAPDKVPPFQLRTFGDSPEKIARRFLDEVILPEVLLALGAEKAKLTETPPTSYALDRALAEATKRAVRAGVPPKSAITVEEVRRYYDEHKSTFDTPERYLVSRILCKTPDEARAVLEIAKKDLTPDAFYKLAKDRSLDKGTSLRGGDLGFVAADGTSKEPGLRVDVAVPRAAATVKNGELVPEPVVEGEGFAVVWRRASIPASRLPVEEAAAQIKEAIWKGRVEAAEKSLLDELRAKHVSDVHEDKLGGFEVSIGDGGIAPRARPGQVPPRR